MKNASRPVRMLATALIALSALALMALCAFAGSNLTGLRQPMPAALLVGLGLLGALLGGVAWLRRRNAPVEHFFLLLFIPLSLGMMIAMPVFRVPDETAHLQRAYQIATGQFVPQEGVFHEPVNLFAGNGGSLTSLKQAAALFTRRISPELTAIDANELTGIYPVTAYFPQALTMAVANILTDRQGVLMYAARLGGWLATLLMLYAAIRLTPSGKHVMLVVSLLPITLQEAASASADGMAIACVMLLVALVLRIREDRRAFRGALPLLCLSAVGLISFKVMYAPFLLLLLLLPRDAFSSARQRGLVLGCTLLCAVLTLALWAWTSLSPNAVAGSHADQIIPQIQAALGAPLRFAALLVRTCARYAASWGWQMLGGTLGWLNIPVQPPVVVLWAALLLWAALGDRPIDQPRPVRAMVWGITLCLFLGILCALYAWWTPADGRLIEGVQGRYFLPCAAPVLMGFSGVIRQRSASSGQAPAMIYGSAACLGVCTLLNVLAYTLS